MDTNKSKLLAEEDIMQRESFVTVILLSAIGQSLIGIFLFGYNTSLFNIPSTVIRANASEKAYLSDIEWEIVNAMFPFGAGIGALFTGYIADRYGRRKFLLINSIICIIGSIITSFSFNYIQLLFGRFIVGITSGCATGVSSVYLNEISPIKLRGVIGTTIQLVITLAIVISELLGKIWLINNWYWRIGCIIPAILSLIQLIVSLLTLPYSPKWLAQKGELDRAIKELSKLRGTNETVQIELQEYISQSNINNNDDNGYSAPITMDSPNNDQTIDSIDNSGNDAIMGNGHNDYSFHSVTPATSRLINKDNIKRREFDENIGICEAINTYKVISKILFLSLFIHMLQQLSGINVVFYYSQDILESVGVSNAWAGSVAIATANCLAVVAVTFCIDKAGRRPLMLISSAGMVVSAVLLTIMFSGLNNSDDSFWGVGAIICLVLYVVTFELGLGPIPWLYVAEITPIEYRGTITSIAQMVNYSCNTIIAVSSTSLLSALGVYGFLPFGVVCFIGFIFIWKYLPETKQKTVDEILNIIDPPQY